MATYMVTSGRWKIQKDAGCGAQSVVRLSNAAVVPTVGCECAEPLIALVPIGTIHCVAHTAARPSEFNACCRTRTGPHTIERIKRKVLYQLSRGRRMPHVPRGRLQHSALRQYLNIRAILRSAGVGVGVAIRSEDCAPDVRVSYGSRAAGDNVATGGDCALHDCIVVWQVEALCG
jgi:hypothetical protein